jgi:hypothetical protein
MPGPREGGSPTPRSSPVKNPGQTRRIEGGRRVRRSNSVRCRNAFQEFVNKASKNSMVARLRDSGSTDLAARRGTDVPGESAVHNQSHYDWSLHLMSSNAEMQRGLAHLGSPIIDGEKHTAPRRKRRTYRHFIYVCVSIYHGAP